MSTRPRTDPAGLPGLVRDVVRSSRGHDLALYSAGVTFYAAVGVVPLLLLSIYLAGLVVGHDTVRDLSVAVVARLPRAGAQDTARALTEAGSRLGPTAAVAALVPASLYGEGLVRAFDRLSVRGERGRRTLRGRLSSLVLVVLSPALLLLGLASTTGLSHALGEGVGPRLLGIYVAFLVTWVAVSVLLVLAYRVVAPERPCTRALLWGAFGTGSVVAGTSLGYLLFLGLRIPLERAYGGSSPVASAAVSFLWLYLLHAMVLVGYVTTLRLSARQGHPRGPVLEEQTVRPMARAA